VCVSAPRDAGSCFIPFHFREAAANVLTIDEIDLPGKIPEYVLRRADEAAVAHDRASGWGRS
jgi:formate dehydrogenase major subunit